VICPALVAVAAARRHVPADVEVVATAPGRTAGGLLLARYEGPSTLRYSELLVLPALTRVAGKLGWWISHAYVDSPASLAGGREMWGVPKDLATFTWSDGGVVVIREDGLPLLDCDVPTPARTAPVPALVAANGTTGGADRRRFLGAGLLRMAPVRLAVDVPAQSPFASLGLGARRRLALAGHADLRLRAPRVLSA
jgi:hypothetical protein